MFGETAGPGGVPLVDSLLEIRRADGGLITSADGGASSQINVANFGFDAILGYTPPRPARTSSTPARSTTRPRTVPTATWSAITG